MPEELFAYSTAGQPPRTGCQVFLPGWAFDGRVLQLTDPPRAALTTTRPASPAVILAELQATIDRLGLESVVLTGWSLGAYLALEFAQSRPEQVSALYLLAARNHWPAEEITEIRLGLTTDPRQFLHTFYRKCFLGYRREYQFFLDSLEEDYLNGLTPDTLAAGLDYLANYAPNAKLALNLAHGLEVHLLQGGRDIVAPPADAIGQDTTLFKVCKSGGHPLFLEPDYDPEQHRRKDALRRKFSRAATTYDRHAIVQQECAELLAARLPATEPTAILELGCGTGNYTRLLAARYPAASIVALDFAAEMLAVARTKLPDDRIHLHCVDAEIFLERQLEKFDLITANATLQWFDDLPGTAARMAERLKPGGTTLCSIFGPGSLRELRAGLTAVNPGKISLPADDFPTADRLRQILAPLFPVVEIEEHHKVRSYSGLAELLGHIRHTGTGGWPRSQPLLDRSRLATMDQWFRENLGEYRLTYQIFLVRCLNP